jgi:hypothetical protein
MSLAERRRQYLGPDASDLPSTLRAPFMTLASAFVASIPKLRRSQPVTFGEIPDSALVGRLALLVAMSRGVAHCFPAIDLSALGCAGSLGAGLGAGGAGFGGGAGAAGYAASLASLVSRSRSLVMTCVKSAAVDAAVADTSGDVGPRITVNRIRASKAMDGGDGSRTVFAQIASQLNSMPPRVLRVSERAWHVEFAGEGAED